MDPRRLTIKGTLQSPPTGQDSVGQPTGSYATVATVYGNLLHLNGLEIIKAGAETSIVKASLRINWRATITAGWRFVTGTRTYEITAVLPDARKRYIDLALELVT
jgi:SPP1 family predicted phage head-tail adaptor